MARFGPKGEYPMFKVGQKEIIQYCITCQQPPEGVPNGVEVQGEEHTRCLAERVTLSKGVFPFIVGKEWVIRNDTDIFLYIMGYGRRVSP